MASDGIRLSCYFFIVRLRLILWMAHVGGYRSQRVYHKTLNTILLGTTRIELPGEADSAFARDCKQLP
jgi:hypothetical protein